MAASEFRTSNFEYVFIVERLSFRVMGIAGNKSWDHEPMVFRVEPAPECRVAFLFRDFVVLDERFA